MLIRLHINLWFDVYVWEGGIRTGDELHKNLISLKKKQGRTKGPVQNNSPTIEQFSVNMAILLRRGQGVLPCFWQNICTWTYFTVAWEKYKQNSVWNYAPLIKPCCFNLKNKLSSNILPGKNHPIHLTPDGRKGVQQLKFHLPDPGEGLVILQIILYKQGYLWSTNN